MIPFEHRYSYVKAPRSVMKLIRKIDPQLDLKFYAPTEKWHVVRYLGPVGESRFEKCFDLVEDEELGKHAFPGPWLYEYLMKCDTQRRDLLAEVEESEAEYHRNLDAKTKDIAHEMAKDMRKPLIAELDGAETTKTVWQGGI